MFYSPAQLANFKVESWCRTKNLLDIICITTELEPLDRNRYGTVQTSATISRTPDCENEENSLSAMATNIKDFISLRDVIEADIYGHDRHEI